MRPVVGYPRRAPQTQHEPDDVLYDVVGLFSIRPGSFSIELKIYTKTDILTLLWRRKK
jgi:hypothetical protein